MAPFFRFFFYEFFDPHPFAKKKKEFPSDMYMAQNDRSKVIVASKPN
jgi:hypothetical protein